jgi:hypothetical protein
MSTLFFRIVPRWKWQFKPEMKCMNGFWSNCRCLGDEHLGLVTSIDRIAIFQNTFVALPLKFRLNYGLLIIDRPYRSYPRKERAVLKWTVKKWFFWSNTLSLSKKIFERTLFERSTYLRESVYGSSSNKTSAESPKQIWRYIIF